MAKIYTDKIKYSGKNDSFVFKLTIFREIWVRADIPREILLKVFAIMLISLVLHYYYLNTSISIAATFDKVCESIRIYFEMTKYKKNILSKLNMTNLKFIIEKNKRKVIEESLQPLIKDLCCLQYGLDVEHRIDKIIYNKLINTYQDILACQYGYFKSANSLADLINNLHSSIITLQKATLIICRHKPFLSISAIINSIKYHHQFMLERILEIIVETSRSGLRRKSALFITKKVVGQATILEKSVRIPKISSKTVFSRV